MMPGYFAALAAQALAETEARLQRQEAERQAAAQVEQFDNLARRMRQGDVIDVEAREVPDVLPLPAPTNNAQPIRDQVGTTERDTNE
jgi:cytidylate kinase